MSQFPLTEQEAKEAWDYWYPLVYGYFYRRVNNSTDVEELTANCVTALLLKQGVQSPQAFIWQTARNQLVEYIKQKTKRPSFSDLDSVQHLAGFNPQTDEEIEKQYSEHFLEKRERLKECIKSQLKDEDYKIVWASVIENKNSTAIGEDLDLKSNTVRQKLKRAIEKVKKHCTQIWQDLGQSSQ